MVGAGRTINRPQPIIHLSDRKVEPSRLTELVEVDLVSARGWWHFGRSEVGQHYASKQCLSKFL